jgi:predicted amidohydrolase
MPHSPPVTVACVQLTFPAGDVAGNVARAARGVKRAAQGGAELVLLPELWDSGYHLPTAQAIATGTGEGAFAVMANLAARHGLFLAGSSAERDRDHTYNTLALYRPDGACAATYRKLHLFGPLGEHDVFVPGRNAQVVECPWGPTALSICYDLRFPELYRAYAVRDAVLALVCAAWPPARIDHWNVLLRARAIENGLTVAACNHPAAPDRSPGFGGRSALIDAWGQTVAAATGEPAVLIGTLDTRTSEAARSTIPALLDRRPGTYRVPRPEDLA